MNEINIYAIFRIKVWVTFLLIGICSFTLYVAGVIFGQSFSPWSWSSNCRMVVALCFVVTTLLILAFIWIKTETNE